MSEKKEENKNDQVVIAIFDSQDFANYGINLFKKWDDADGGVSLGSIGTISKDEKGKIKTHQPHKTGGGAKLGALLGVIAAILTGGTSWLVGAIGGTALGAVGGTFFKKSLHLDKEQVAKLGEHLDQGKVAVIVTCDEHEVAAVSEELTKVGGDIFTYSVPAEAIDEAAAELAATGADQVAAVTEVAAESAAEAVAPEASAAPEAAAPDADSEKSA